jgi:hypothetical protein
MISVVISATVTWEFTTEEVISSVLIDSNFSSYDDFRKQLKESFFANLM